ncbi:MAG: glycoside hydrolase family 3 C-terminal domain-containing protein [Chitinophagales bacterium]|nr:glycoside hydrolase family 3 C-terminal domain-containing protein [Chitinophagales bacterium]
MDVKKLVAVLIFSFFYSHMILAQLFISEKKKPEIYHDDWIDLNKNNKMDVYENSNESISNRIDDLIDQMTLEEKTCQMATLYGYKRVLEDELPTEEWQNRIYKDGIGNIDEHLNGLAYHPDADTEYSWPPSKHARAINEVQRFFIEETRLGIPVDFTNEGIRGICHEGGTSFPAQIGVGSTWNKELVSEIGRITGSEAKALGYTNVYSPILDIARDPRWGRTVECYGEDPYLVSQLGLEMVKSLQKEGVASTAKHFAVYSAPKGGRDGAVRTDPHITEREMHFIYLEPFRKAVVEADMLGVMSSYNDYNGVPITGSSYFLIDILRNEWGFNGYVVSDSWAVGGLKGRHHVSKNMKESVFLSVMSGLNIRTNFTPAEDFIFPLRELVEEGKVPMEIINQRVKDVLEVKFRLGLFDKPYVEDPAYADGVVSSEDSEKIALQASRESLILLKNSESLLPVDKTSLGAVLVTGPNAKAIDHSISRYGPSKVKVISVLEGVENIAGNQIDVQYAKGCDFYDENWPKKELYDIPPSATQQAYIDEAVEKAKKVDLVVAVVGGDESTVGESKSRTSLDLPGNQIDLLKALHATGKPIVVVLINGRPLSINWTNDHINAIIEAWFPGKYGGKAIAEAIFGEYNPGGKLPATFPKTVGQIPFNFPYKKSSQNGQDGHQTRINDALYPFGYGLSYTSFEYSDLRISSEKAKADFDKISISFKIKNTGKTLGDEVPQLYIQDEYSSIVPYDKLLKGFERITLKPGQEKEVVMTIFQEDLSMLDMDMNRLVEPGKFNVFIGSSSEDIRLQGAIVIE